MNGQIYCHIDDKFLMCKGGVPKKLAHKVEGSISERDHWPSPMDVPWIMNTAQLGWKIRAK